MRTANDEHSEYRVPRAFSEVEYDIRKSRFIARVHPLQSREAAMVHIEQARRAYPDASHHCWAFLVGPPWSPRAVAQADDGEPSGTAGRPILNVIEHKKVGDILIVVVRYFGGVKLGAGGLVRAYSQSAQRAMASLKTVIKVPRMDSLFSGDFAAEQPLRQWLQDNDGELVAVDYGEGIICEVRFPVRLQDAFSNFCHLVNGRLVTGD